MKALLREIRRREEKIVRLLGQFVRCESPSYDKAAVDRFGRMVAREWRRRGAQVRVLRQKVRGNHVRAELWLGEGRPAGQILILGHLDTVYPLGTLAKMPFCISGGRAWGPGTFDMKAGIVLALAAVDALNASTSAERAERAAIEWRVLEADLHFHQVIFDHTHNQFIRVIADALRAQLYRVRQSAEQGLYDSAPALAEHRMILTAVATGDPATAERAMKRHIDLVESRSAADLALAEADRGGRSPDSAADEKR